MADLTPDKIVVQTPRTDQLYKAIGSRVSSISEATHTYSKSNFNLTGEEVMEHSLMLAFAVTGVVFGVASWVAGEITRNVSFLAGVTFAFCFAVCYSVMIAIAIKKNETEEITIYFDYASESDGHTGETPEVKIQVTQGNQIIYDNLPISSSKLVLMANHLATGGRVSRNQFIAAGIIHKNGYSELFNAMLMAGYLAQDGGGGKPTPKLQELVRELATVPLG